MSSDHTPVLSTDDAYGSTGKPHPYHIVRPSIWPLVASFAGGLFALGVIFFAHEISVMDFNIGKIVLPLGVLSILAVMFYWWKDVIFESVTEKAHTPIAEIGLRYGMALFIAFRYRRVEFCGFAGLAKLAQERFVCILGGHSRL